MKEERISSWFCRQSNKRSCHHHYTSESFLAFGVPAASSLRCPGGCLVVSVSACPSWPHRGREKANLFTLTCFLFCQHAWLGFESLLGYLYQWGVVFEQYDPITLPSLHSHMRGSGLCCQSEIYRMQVWLLENDLKKIALRPSLDSYQKEFTEEEKCRQSFASISMESSENELCAVTEKQPVPWATTVQLL